MLGINIASLDATTLAEMGVAMPVRDPAAVRDSNADVDTRPFLLADETSKAPVTITVLGPDADKVARMLVPLRARIQTQAIQTQTKKGLKISSEDILIEESDYLELAIAATTGWFGLLGPDNEPWPCTEENKRKLFTVSRDIRLQVTTFVQDRMNFLPKR